MKLLIISHTEHYRRNGQVVGWGPTVREIDFLAGHFEEIYHIACLHPGEAPPSALPYTQARVRFVPIPPFGGPGIWNKIKIALTVIPLLWQVFRCLRKVDAFQFRAPTSIGVLLIPVLTLLTRKKGWFKYAGNWAQENPPISYALQRWLLRWQSRTVTINGRWPGQQSHFLSFENPCLDAPERETGKAIAESKTFRAPFRCCFVGRLEDEKGVGRILEALAQLPSGLVEKVYLVGDGPQRPAYEKKAQVEQLPVVFNGFLPRNEIRDIYATSHFILFPSLASEGFPKVLAEAMNYGCLPVTSPVSSIPQYIGEAENGFVWQPGQESYAAALQRALSLQESDYQAFTKKGYATAEAFTLEHYAHRILTEILRQP